MICLLPVCTLQNLGGQLPISRLGHEGVSIVAQCHPFHGSDMVRKSRFMRPRPVYDMSGYEAHV